MRCLIIISELPSVFLITILVILIRKNKALSDESFGNWVIIKRIDEGGFGQVYKVQDVVTKKYAALKAESNDIEGGSALKLEPSTLPQQTVKGLLVYKDGFTEEMQKYVMAADVADPKSYNMNVMRTIAADGEKPHVPTVFHAAKRRRFCYMIMTLLGENLKELKLSCPKEYMTARTWTRIAIQCLYSVKVVHDYGFVHRDIKPNNFVMGYREDYERARIVHILDFGLSRSYAVKQKDGKWVPRRARGTAEFRGTLRYCSPNVHEKKEQTRPSCTNPKHALLLGDFYDRVAGRIKGNNVVKKQGRRDDLWSLYYVFIELHCGLPWQTLRDKQKVELLKLNMSDQDLVLNFPVELHGIIPYLRTLNYYQRPDYSMFYNGLVAVMKRVGAKASDPYDWEKPETVRNIQKRLKGPYAWENAADFFKSDPIKVNSAPPPKKKRRKTQPPPKYPPLMEEEVKRDSSEQTTGSTDIERRVEMPTELSLPDVEKKLFERFGVRSKDDQKLRELGVRLSGEILQGPLEIDDLFLGDKDDKKDFKIEKKKTKTDEEKKDAKGKEKKDEKIKSKEKPAAASKEKAVPMSKEKVANISKEKIAHMSKEKGVHMSKEKGVQMSKEKGAHMSKEKVIPKSREKIVPLPKEKVVSTPSEQIESTQKPVNDSKEKDQKKEEKKVVEELEKKEEPTEPTLRNGDVKDGGELKSKSSDSQQQLPSGNPVQITKSGSAPNSAPAEPPK